MIVELLCQRRIRYSNYHNEYRREFRSFQRDLQHLRKIGEHAGFRISNVKDHEYADLVALDGKARNLNKDTERVERLTATIARALGEPIARELGAPAIGGSDADDFFSVSSPRLIEGTLVADICATLREAHSSPTGRAAVRFQYGKNDGGPPREREVEPYRLTYRSGNFYLIGYDRGSKGWRIFGIDRFRSKPIKAGTCSIVRSIPPDYASNDTIGFFRGPGPRVAVTVELSARVAAGVSARVWQAEQQIEPLADGRVRMTFNVADIDEVVRWTLGFGSEARIVSPTSAVERVKCTALELLIKYEGEPQ